MTPTTTTISPQFDDAYWASQPPAVQALRNAGANRLMLAVQLAQAGYLIDEDIMVWGWDPGQQMARRVELGLPYVPSLLLQPLGATPGYAYPGITPGAGQLPFPSSMPAGWMRVSVALSDYPSFDPPAPPKTPVYTLGPQIAKGVYIVSSSTGVFPPVGQQITVGNITGTLAVYGMDLYVIEAGGATL